MISVRRGRPACWRRGWGWSIFDMRLDAEDEESGAPAGTPRTIEGPLYVGGAPLVAGHARLDDATEQGDTLIMHGIVRSVEGNPIPGALVDVWHDNTKGLRQEP